MDLGLVLIIIFSHYDIMDLGLSLTIIIITGFGLPQTLNF